MRRPTVSILHFLSQERLAWSRMYGVSVEELSNWDEKRKTGKSVTLNGVKFRIGRWMDKVHVFWEGHKNRKNLHRRFDITYVVSVKLMVKILSIFAAFLENTNFRMDNSLSIFFIKGTINHHGKYFRLLVFSMVHNYWLCYYFSNRNSWKGKCYSHFYLVKDK